MHHLSTDVMVWLAALVIVMPIPDAWVKTVICLVMVLLTAFFL